MAVPAETLSRRRENTTQPIEVTRVEAKVLLRERIRQIKSGRRNYKWAPLVDGKDRYNCHVFPSSLDPKVHPGYHLFGENAGKYVLLELMEEARIDTTAFVERMERRGSGGVETRVRTYSTADPVGNRLVFKLEEPGFTRTVSVSKPPMFFVPLQYRFFVRKV